MKECGGNENRENGVGEKGNKKPPNDDCSHNTMFSKTLSKNQTRKNGRKVTEKQKISICNAGVYPGDSCDSIEGMIDSYQKAKCEENKTDKEKNCVKTEIQSGPYTRNNNIYDYKNAGDILPQMLSQRSFIDEPIFKPPTSVNSDFENVWKQQLESKSVKENVNTEEKKRNISYSVCTDRKRKIGDVTDNNKNQTGQSLGLNNINDKSRSLLPCINQTYPEGKEAITKDINIGNSSFQAILDEVYAWSKSRNNGKLLRKDVCFKNIMDDVYGWSKGKMLTRSQSSGGVSIHSSSSCSIHYSIPNIDKSKLRSMKHVDKNKNLNSNFKNKHTGDNKNCMFKHVRFSTKCSDGCLQRHNSDQVKYQNVCNKNCKCSSCCLKSTSLIKTDVNCKQKPGENEGKQMSYKDTLVSLNKCIHSGFNLATQVSNGVQSKELWTQFFDPTKKTSKDIKWGTGLSKNSLVGYCMDSKNSGEPSLLEILACGQETPLWENSSSSLTSTVMSTTDRHQCQNNVLEKHGWKKFPLEEMQHSANICSDDTETPMWASCMSSFDSSFTTPELVQMSNLWNPLYGSKINKGDSSLQQKTENPTGSKCLDNLDQKCRCNEEFSQPQFVVMGPQLKNVDNTPFVKICVMNNVNQNTKLFQDFDIRMQSKDHKNYISVADRKKCLPSLHPQASLISSNPGNNPCDSFKSNTKYRSNSTNALYNPLRVDEDVNGFISVDQNCLGNQFDRTPPCPLPEYLPSTSDSQTFVTKSSVQTVRTPSCKDIQTGVNVNQEKETNCDLETQQNGSLNESFTPDNCNSTVNKGEIKDYYSYYDTTIPTYSILEISNIKWEAYIENFNRENDLSCLLKTISTKLKGQIKITGGSVNCFCNGSCPSVITNIDSAFLLKVIEQNNCDENKQVYSCSSGVISSNDVVDKSIECLILVNDNKDKCKANEKEGNVDAFNQKVELISGENGMCIPNYIVNAIENFDWEPLIPGFNKENDLPMLVEVIGSKLNEIFVFSDNGTSCLCNLPKMALEFTASQMIAIISKSLKKIQNVDKNIFYNDLPKSSDCDSNNVNMGTRNNSDQSMKSYLKRQTFFNQIIASIDTDLNSNQHIKLKKELSCDTGQQKKVQAVYVSNDLYSKDTASKKSKDFSRRKKLKSKVKNFQHAKNTKKSPENKRYKKKKKLKQQSLVEIPCYDICDIEDIDWECYLLDFDRKKDMKFLLRTIRSKLEGVINISGNNNECVCCAPLPPAFSELDPCYLYYIIECNLKPIEIHSLSALSVCSKEKPDPMELLKEQEEHLECLEKLLLRRIVKLYTEKNKLADLEAINGSDLDSVSDSCSTESDSSTDSDSQNVNYYSGKYCDADDDDGDQQIKVCDNFNLKDKRMKDKINVIMKPAQISKQNYNRYLKKSAGDNIGVPYGKDILQITNHQLSDLSVPSRISFNKTPHQKHKSSKINVCKKEKMNYYSFDWRISSKNSSHKILHKNKAGLSKLNPLDAPPCKKVKTTDILPKIGWHKKKTQGLNSLFDDNTYKFKLGSSKKNILKQPKLASKFLSPLNLIYTGQSLSKKLAKSTSNLQNTITKHSSTMTINGSNPVSHYKEKELMRKDKPKGCEKDACFSSRALKLKPIIKQKFKIAKVAGRNSKMKYA